MRTMMIAILVALGMTLSASAQDKDQIKERMNAGKEQVKAGVTVVK